MTKKPTKKVPEVFDAPAVPAANALDDFYYDQGTGKFWCSKSNLGWQLLGTDATKRKLAKRGFALERGANQNLSPADNALDTITETRAVDGSFPGFFRKEEIIEHHQYRLLNTSRVRFMPPHHEPHPDPVGFPWVWKYYTDLFGEQQRTVFFSWLAYFYRSALAGRPSRGQALFIAGPIGSGKSFSTNAVLKPVFGAVGEATKFLCGEDQFNSGIFGCPIWNVDDAVSNSDHLTHSRFSAAVKHVVACDEFTMRAMHKEGVRMPWNGRLVVTMNDDPDSIRMLPSGEGSMLDKYILLHARATYDQFPSDEAVRPELPHMCAYLRDMPDDPAVMVGGRFGVIAYHHPDLMRMAREESPTFSTFELIQNWLASWFSDKPKVLAWEGNPTALAVELSQFDHNGVMRSLKLSPSSLGRNLNKLIMQKVAGIEKVPSRSGGRLYRLTRELLPS